MKKLILFFTAVFITAISANVFAQGTGVAPGVGSEQTYTVTANATSNFTWDVTSDVEGTTSVIGINPTDVANFVSGSTTNSVVIRWANPTIGNIYYVQLMEEVDSTGCINRKALAVEPVNLFELEIENYELADAKDTVQDFSICAADVLIQSFNGTNDSTLADAQNFTYNYQKDSVFYRIYATGLNTTTTAWAVLVAPAYDPGGVATYYYSTDGGTSYNVVPSNFLISVDDGSSEVFVKAVIDNGITHEGTTAKDVTLVLVEGDDVNGNQAISLGNVSRNQIIKARPETSEIGTTE